MSAWTPEPWPEIQPSGTLTRIGFGALPSVFIFHVDYERARACVNALPGIVDPPTYLQFLRDSFKAADKIAGEEIFLSATLRAQRDELAAALRGVIRVADRKTVEFNAARAALAKVSP